jgi:2-C-methyl-D-erythritol 4-phosphate cytidylyltransferase
MNTAIIVAAGEGSRFGGERPKQFAEILGKPVLIHSIERFEQNDLVDEIVLVLSDREMTSFSDIAEGFGIRKLASIVAGGRSRSESVLNGLSVVRSEESGIVAIHDGARPVVPQDDITNAIRAAERTGAACLVAPIADTVKETEDGLVIGTVDRRTLRRALTPQCFRYEVIRDAFEFIDPGELVTDDSSLVEASGGEVAAVPGSPLNIKITFDHDLPVAELFLRRLLDQESGE